MPATLTPPKPAARSRRGSKHETPAPKEAAASPTVEQAPRPQSPDPGEPAVHAFPALYRFSTAQYYRMSEHGLLDEDDRTELIDGIVTRMKPPGPFHSSDTSRLVEVLPGIFRGRAIVRIQDPIHLREGDDPQPDAVLCTYREDRYKGRHPEPEDILLIVEISDSSLGFDRGAKLALYAATGIREYWILNVQARTLEVYHAPVADSVGHRYASMQTLTRDATVAPLAFPDDPLSVADLVG